MLGCALDPSLHMLGCALHSGLHNKVASVLVQHGVVCCSITNLGLGNMVIHKFVLRLAVASE